MDLSACEREPVHIPGSIQPFGCLIAFSLPTWSISQLSLNALGLLEAEDAGTLLGQPIELIFPPKVIHDLRNTFQAAMISGFAERLADVAVGPDDERRDILVYPSGQSAVIEIIHGGGVDTVRTDPTSLVKTVVDRLRRTPNFQAFLSSAARQVRAVTGYDRVMIYRFLEDDSGQVVAEAVRGGLPPFLHLHYPASDIPIQARNLFKRQWLRMIPNVDYEPDPIVPAVNASGAQLDLTLSALRSASPIHLQYLRNMGSAATLTVSILDGDRLWGLIACHHETPRRISAATCAAVELLGQVFSAQIEAKQQRDRMALIAKAHDAHDRLMAAMRPEETIFQNLKSFETLLQAMIPCDGIGIWTENRFEGAGLTPPADAIEQLVQFLNQGPSDRIFVTRQLTEHVADASRYVAEASGMIAIPFSRAPKDYLLLFRREVVQTVQWGGNPNKPTQPSAATGVIGPRASFAAWQEQVRGTSLPWRSSETTIAETLRVSLLDMMLRRANILDRERRIAQESQLLLVAELNHRVKNVLAIIHSLVRQSAQGAGSVEVFRADLQSRIHALSIAHDQLTQSHWKAAPLQTLIEVEAQAWTDVGETRLDLVNAGPPVMVEARAYQTLALVLHELMTNAAKYGALSVADGRLSISWGIEDDGALALVWREENGPAVIAPKRRGFGSLVIEQSIPFELKGQALVEYKPGGVHARFIIPAPFVERGSAGVVPQHVALPKVQADLRGKSLLLVEDSMMIALDAQTMLQNCGADVEVAANTSDARRAIKVNSFDAAILDVNLYTETSFLIAEDLLERAIPFVFATGYGEKVTVPERFRNILVVSKPYEEYTLRAALAV
jgi:light-regulated signal transduction histidine kinase (bacteriophytochrome)